MPYSLITVIEPVLDPNFPSLATKIKSGSWKEISEFDSQPKDNSINRITNF